jgi:hypothetical protein
LIDHSSVKTRQPYQQHLQPEKSGEQLLKLVRLARAVVIFSHIINIGWTTSGLTVRRASTWLRRKQRLVTLLLRTINPRRYERVLFRRRRRGDEKRFTSNLRKAAVTARAVEKRPPAGWWRSRSCSKICRSIRDGICAGAASRFGKESRGDSLAGNKDARLQGARRAGGRARITSGTSF